MALAAAGEPFMSFGTEFLNCPELFPARRAGEPWGDHHVTIDFLGGPYLFSGLHQTQVEAVRNHFGPYYPKDDASPCGSVEIRLYLRGKAISENSSSRAGSTTSISTTTPTLFASLGLSSWDSWSGTKILPGRFGPLRSTPTVSAKCSKIFSAPPPSITSWDWEAYWYTAQPWSSTTLPTFFQDAPAPENRHCPV